MARTGNEAYPEPLDIVERVVEGVDLELAAVARTCVDVPDGQRPSQNFAQFRAQRLAHAQRQIRLGRWFRCDADGGDVAARVSVRFDELQMSMQLALRMLEQLPAGTVRLAMPAPAAAAGELAIGLIEGWRGPVMLALEPDGHGGIARCHAHDPSWQNWPVLEHAILGNIVPDFPLINKSFNLSYSGQDL